MDNVYGVDDLTVAVTHPKDELNWNGSIIMYPNTFCSTGRQKYQNQNDSHIQDSQNNTLHTMMSSMMSSNLHGK